MGTSIEALICSYSWDCGTALRVFTCESGLDPNALSPDGQNFGIAQVNAVHAARVGGNLSLLFDPVVNVRVAWDIYVDNGGWGPWSCY